MVLAAWQRDYNEVRSHSALTRLRGLGFFADAGPLSNNGLSGKVFTTGVCWDVGSSDPRWWLWRQIEPELLDQKSEFRLRLGVAGPQQFAHIGCRQMDIDHLNGGELLERAARGPSWRQGMQATLQRTR